MQLHRDRDKFEAAGARLVVIGQGTPEQARHFLESHKLEIPIYVDKGRESYKAAGTKVGDVRRAARPADGGQGRRGSPRATASARVARSVTRPSLAACS